MKTKKIFSNMAFKLILSVAAGLFAGQFAGEKVISVILPVKHVLGQIIFFLVPLIIFGFVASSVTRMKKNASKILGISLLIAYVSSVIAAVFAIFAGYGSISLFDLKSSPAIRELPEMIFRLDIPPLMSVMSALALALTVGLAIVWTNAEKIENLLYQFQDIVTAMVNKILIPVLPFFVFFNFSILSYEGTVNSQLPFFAVFIIITILCNVVWVAFSYLVAGLYSRKNPWRVLKHYGPVILTALGTQSSAASLGVAIEAAKKSDVLDDDVRGFAIPFFANIHFCGSVLNIVFLVIVISQILYGSIPSIDTLALFTLLLGIFAIGAPGLPGGTVVASLGLIQVVVGFDETATALLFSVFALQDSFGTANNITSDGALTLMLSSSYSKKNDQD
ncbi:MAG: dicarboxylate/amino acid:cation symporter [Prevotellaceae bacterium]|jgi:Na+/H+-dicarboxylate symporter|nr:dicarboxylate/amino acid:cation symporter [Prevotellaceae bacterium]